MVSFRYLVGNVHVLLVRAGVDAVPLVDVDPRDVLPDLLGSNQEQCCVGQQGETVQVLDVVAGLASVVVVTVFGHTGVDP